MHSPAEAAAAGAEPSLDVEALAERFTAFFPRVEPRAAAMALALYRLLGEGRPVDWPTLARRSGWTPEALRAQLARWPGVYERGGALTGFGGLSVLQVSRHRLRVQGRTLHTRCAWDTLWIPALLDVTADVESTCAVNGTPVRLTVSAQRAAVRAPGTLWLSMMEPQAEMARDLTQHF